MFRTGDKALALLKQLSFPRPAGSDAERRAASLIVEEAERYGFHPAVESFQVAQEIPAEASLVLLGPERISYEVTGLINAASTPEAGQEADFYYLEYADEAGLRRVRGKFVLLNQRPSEQEYTKLVEAGAAGLLLMSGSIRDTAENSDLDTVRLRDSWRQHGSLPAFQIATRDALGLLQHDPKRVRFLLRQRREVLTSQNLVLTVPGSDLAEEVIAVGAHYDSTRFSYGAWDNGAGVVQVLALLAHLAAHPPRRTVRILFFGSEEIGLEGSKAYLKAHPEEQKLLAMVNLDVGGSYLGNNMIAVTGSPSAEHYLAGLQQEAGYSAKTFSGVMSSDSATFSDYGIPAVFLGRHAPPGGGYMHTRYDTIDLISPHVLEEEIRFLLFLSDRLTGAEVFPIKRVIPGELRRKLVQYFGTGLSHIETITDLPEEEPKSRSPFG